MSDLFITTLTCKRPVQTAEFKEGRILTTWVKANLRLVPHFHERVLLRFTAYRGFVTKPRLLQKLFTQNPGIVNLAQSNRISIELDPWIEFD